MATWDERKLAKSLRIAVKELRLFKDDARRHGEKLSAVDGDGEAAEAQRERGDAWGELADSIDTAAQEVEDALESVEPLF